MPIAEFIAALSRFHVLEAGQIDELSNFAANDAKLLVRQLIERGWLTPFQANLLLQNRGSELLLGSYVLLEKLGEGGMGAVYRARNWKLGRTVALKLIRKERLAGPDAIRRFGREIRAASQLDHVNVVRAYDADEVNGTHFFVMEYVDGIDLERLVREHGPLPPRLACTYISQAARGLQHAHERGLVHRDIKPANLLLTRGTGAGVVKILDMGLARRDESDDEKSGTLTQVGMVMGTPDYMAPEQSVSSHTVDIRADLYSLGCSLYFLLTGSVLFPGGSLTEKLLKHQLDQPRPIEMLRPEVPTALAEAVYKLLAKKRDERFQTPAELAEALDAILKNPKVRATTKDAATAIQKGMTKIDPFWAKVVAEVGSDDTVPVAAPTANRKPWLIVGGCLAGMLLVAGIVIALNNRGSPTPAPPPGINPIDFSGDVPPMAQVPFAADDAAELQRRWAAYLKHEVFETNSIGMKLLLIPPGSFVMGGTNPASLPQHPVRLTRPFRLGVHEVTQAQYQTVIGTNPAEFNVTNDGGADHPVEMVTWHEAVAFCRKLSERPEEVQAGRRYRLPTEAEWEFACRAGAESEHWWGNDKTAATDLCNCDSVLGRTAKVGSYKKNPFGLHDISGNVQEWCADRYAPFTADAVDDPVAAAAAAGGARMLRGGSWSSKTGSLASFNRAIRWAPEKHANNTGFRVVCELAEFPPLGFVNLFGNDLSGWQGLMKYWSLNDSTLRGASPAKLPFNTFLCSNENFRDFELMFQVRLKEGNSGVQIRSEIALRDSFSVRGPQVDMGDTYWGCLYGERFGGMMQAADAGKVSRILKRGDFNDFVVKCAGKHVTIILNGTITVDADFPTLPDDGIIAWQLHGGAATEVEFRRIYIKRGQGEPGS